MKQFIVILFLVLLSQYVNAQEEKYPVQLNKHSFAVSILSPGFQYELKLAEKKSLAFLGSSGVYSYASSSNGFQVGFTPYLQSTYRRYYDRKKVNKELKHNSGNYYGAFVYYSDREWLAENMTNNQTVGSGFTWGLQRNYKSNIYLGFSTQLGVTYSEIYGIRGLINTEFRLGFLIK